MADNQDDILAQFAEYLEAKKTSEQEAAQSEDFDVEIFDETGRGVRTRRSHAKPFLQQLGLDLDPEPEQKSGDSAANSDAKPVKRQSTGPQSKPRVSAKYFKPAGK